MKKTSLNKKILIFGGKRVLGSSLVKQLSLDNEVYCVSRTPPPPKMPHVKYLQGDVNDTDFLSSISASNYDVLIDNLAYDEDHVEKVYNILKNNVAKYILTSSSWIYKFLPLNPPFDDIPSNEEKLSFPPNTLKITREYVLGKVRAENKVIKLWNNNCIIIRLPMIFGKNDSTGRLKFIVKRLLNHKPIILINGGTNKFQIAYAPDVAKIYELLCSIKKPDNLWVNIANPDIYTPKDFYELCARFLGITKFYFTHTSEDEIRRTAYDYWQAEPLFREKEHLLNCTKLYNIIPKVTFSKNTNWLKTLCLYESKEIKRNQNTNRAS